MELWGTMGRTTTLYAVDIDGNIILKEKEIDQDDMLIKDYTDFITYEDNTITIYATRVVEDVNYHSESICNAPSNDIVEAYYTYTYQDGKFVKKQTQKIVDAFKKKNIEENGSLDYKIFLNFHVLDDLVVFTFTDGTMGCTFFLNNL